MRYFNGFCLENEEELFKDILIWNDYTLIGFSYGAILAFEKAYNTKTRIDRLILISPAFFQNKKESFKTIQLKAWEKDKEKYIKNFLSSCAFPSTLKLEKYLKTGTKEELKFLLNYRWERSKLQELKKRGVIIELFVGEKDKIIDTKEVMEFFDGISITYLFKNAGHILR